jgi:hypothetical protein
VGCEAYDAPFAEKDAIIHLKRNLLRVKKKSNLKKNPVMPTLRMTVFVGVNAVRCANS